MVKFKKLFPLWKIVFVLALCEASVSVYAIGDSGGGGCDSFDGPLADAVRTGMPANVISEINFIVNSKEQQVDIYEILKEKWNGNEKEKEIERRRLEIKKILEGVRGFSCTPSLLDVAANAGNLDVVNFLLDKPFGFELKIPDDAQLTCQDFSKITNLHRERRKRAFSIILKKNIFNMDARDRDGKTLLEKCKEPELMSLFIEYGAHADMAVASLDGNSSWSLLERAIYDALPSYENKSVIRQSKAIDRVAVLAKATTNSIKDSPFELIVKKHCHKYIEGKPMTPEVCKKLNGFIKANLGTFD